MSKLELCSKCHKYKSNLNDEGICAECEVVEYDNPKEMDRVIVKDKVIKEKPKMKCEVLDSRYPHRLRESIQCFLEENKIEEVISLSCYFDSSTDYHVAVIIYK